MSIAAPAERSSMPIGNLRTTANVTGNVPQILYHIGYRFPEDLHIVQKLFSEISVVLLCGTPSRATKLASAISEKNSTILNYCRTDRFSIFLPSPRILVASHGIGLGSIDCLLQDVYHLLLMSGAVNWIFIRVGTSGGIGIPPGTIVVTQRALNTDLQPHLILRGLGKEYKFPGRLNEELSNELYRFVENENRKQQQFTVEDGRRSRSLNVILGDTLCAETFFDAQGRFDGVSPLYTDEERHLYFLRCFHEGVRNIEMESLPLAAFATRVGIPALVVSVVFVDRLKEETPTDTVETLGNFESRCVNMVIQYVLRRIEFDVTE